MTPYRLHPGISRDVPRYAQGKRDTRTSAQVTVGISGWKPKPSTPTIALDVNTQMKEWIKKRVLIGVVHSLDHMGTLHATSIIKNETKYLGGVKLTIEFHCSVEDHEYLENKCGWKDWFKWLVRADQHEERYERIALLKILGVTLTLWDEDNFSKIASRFGKIINPFDNIFTRRDYSMGKCNIVACK